MPLVLGCIAVDFTGATDLANTLTRGGLRTVQVNGVTNSVRHVVDRLVETSIADPKPFTGGQIARALDQLLSVEP